MAHSEAAHYTPPVSTNPDRDYWRNTLRQFTSLDTEVEFNEPGGQSKVLSVLADMENNRPFGTLHYDEEQAKFLSKEERYRYRKPVWAVIDSVLAAHFPPVKKGMKKRAEAMSKTVTEFQRRPLSLHAFNQFGRALYFSEKYNEVEHMKKFDSVMTVLDPKFTGVKARKKLLQVLPEVIAALEKEFGSLQGRTP